MFVENSKRTCGNILFKKEMRNGLYLPFVSVKKLCKKVSGTVNQLQMKCIKFKEI